VKPPEPRGLSVLLVEQNLNLRKALVEALQGRGHVLTVCEDTESAWEAYRREHHPLVVLGVQDRRDDVIQFGHRIRSVPEGSSSVLLYVVEHRRARPLQPLLEVADDCLTKPLDPDLIQMRLLAVERLAAERAQRRAAEAELARLQEDLQALRGNTAGNVDDGAPSEPQGPSGFRGKVRRLFGGKRETEEPAGDGRVFPSGPSNEAGMAPFAQVLPELARTAQPQFGEATDAPELRVSDGWWDWDLSANTVTFSPQWKAMLGYRPEDIGNTPEEWFKRVHPDDRDQLKAAIGAHLDGRTPHLENQHRIEKRDGSYASMLSRGLAFRDPAGRPVRFTGSHTDITELRGYDPLTGLPNRSNLMERLGRALERARSGNGGISAVLFLDLDRFKNINYSLGHQVGDQMLKAVSTRLRSCLRGQDSPERRGTTVAHVGGDEFAVLLEGIRESNDAVRVAKRIQDELQAPFEVEGHEVYTSTSIGIAVSSPDYERPEDLLRDADTAMFRAKALGKGSFVVFDAGMHVRAVSLLKLETELRRAVQREEFRVHYQPIVELETGKIAGFEALVRWQHPDGELLLPKDFLTVAEETGLIISIDRQVARDVCKQLRVWNAQFRRSSPVTVAVNVSGVQFLRPDMIVEIDRTLRNYGVYGRSLKLEITESVIMEHARYAADMLKQLKALDVKLSIDDFGTGYSSLSYLRRFEIDTLKVDMSFVSRMDTDDESWEIIRTIVTLGNNLGKDVVAEGIERGKQRELLLALHCKYGQGYFFSRPVDAEAATGLLVADARGETLLKA
jgi:diguanylate cyclase (GGDEF)-like protein/PAS domain S-box-containing protein